MARQTDQRLSLISLVGGKNVSQYLTKCGDLSKEKRYELDLMGNGTGYTKKYSETRRAGLAGHNIHGERQEKLNSPVFLTRVQPISN